MLHVRQTVKAESVNAAHCCKYSVQKSCHLPISIHNCYCVARSLHVNGRRCIYAHPLNMIALTSRACFSFPVVVPVFFCISSVTDLQPHKGDVYREKGTLTGGHLISFFKLFILRI